MNQLTYRMTIQLKASASPFMEDEIASIVGFVRRRCGAKMLDCYAEDSLSAKIIFGCPEFPDEIRDQVVRPLVSEFQNILYVDVEYIYQWEFIPDRFVMYDDGTILEYTGRIEYTEDN